jgi:excisionase family DNA binding protein
MTKQNTIPLKGFSMLKVAYLTVYRWIQANKLEHIRLENKYRITNEI